MELSELTAYAAEKFHVQEQHKWADFPGFSVLADPGTGKWIALLMRQWDSDSGKEIQRCDIKCGQNILSELSEPYLSLPFRMEGRMWVGIIFNDRTKPDVIFRLFDRAVYSGEERGYTIVLDETAANHTDIYQDTALPFVGKRSAAAELKIPDKIREMLRLYEYNDGSFAQKCRNFHRQGKFMEDYEDDAPWTGEYKHYFPTYHDLNIKQLRGYFAWRTGVRKGNFSPIATSLAYLYLYELLNGIGTSSPEDSLKKMREFETGFLDSGIGDLSMRKNLHRWMLEYAVIHNVPAALVRKYVDSAVMEKDLSLSILREPKKFTDEEVFSALCTFAGKKLEQSPVVKKDDAPGKHLFALVWRYASENSRNGADIFTLCFGEQKSFPWRPLANAVYWEEHPHPDTDYVLDMCRTYHCRGGVWREERYDSLYFDRKRFHAFLHETDRRLRKHLKIGHYLRDNPDEAWAAPYVEQVLAAERQAEIEAARQKITIDLSGLNQIRQDALITRDSLLIEDEIDVKAWDNLEQKQTEEPTKPIEQNETKSICSPIASLDVLHTQILRAILQDEPIEKYMRDNHLMPSVVADTINAALFDEIGDNVLACDGNAITIVEDYREDILQILGGNNK
ncbi:TerB N-terminal domain-containing protein [Ructibacterium gallinarum]|uniref:TerB N-terminal domain-containing protein n=1 Tax=Ructibacterium gallinarum TaxID=2779355 RepID=A0A9D5R8P0_9FIRM|nr:TerB N-terminal domain-containing protein [Ructibacterium gallinarum]MBE5040167.1 TerB N-terminal domain-containing protein [Ructibacterium gallinarum]